MHQQKNKTWIFVLSIIGLVIVSLTTFLSFILLFVPIIGLFSLLDLAITVPLIVLFALTLRKVSSNQTNKGIAIAIIILCAILLVMSIIVGILMIFNPRMVLDLIAASLGIAIGIGSLVTPHSVSNLPLANLQTGGNYVHYNVDHVNHHQNNYHRPYQPNQPTPPDIISTSPKGPMSNEKLKEELKLLKSLLDDGLISQNDYELKKQKLLSDT